MIVEVHITDMSERGVQVRVGDDVPFWLPRSAPGVEWDGMPEVGDVVWVRIPSWLAAKHRQLQELRFQSAFAFQSPNQPAGLDPAKAAQEGSLPMADQSNENRGALFREQNKKSDRAPDMTGHLTINGVRYRLAGWTREDRSGRKYLSLSAEPPREEQHPAPGTPQPQGGNAYAQARSGEPQRQVGGFPSGDGEIPF